jgi:hypothetical protein
MIPQEPLPEGWKPDKDLTDEEGLALDRLLFAGERPEERARARWSLIKNDSTGERAWLRIYGSSAAAVTAFIFAPGEIDERVNNRSVRAVPLAAIELAIQEDEQLRRRKLDNRLGFFEGWSVSDPLGNPREVENFYRRVAIQFLDIKRMGIERPVARMAEINHRPLKTVQGWVTEARKRGLLPPGKPGRAG